MLFRTTKILPGYGHENLLHTWAVEVSMYFPSSREPANVNVKKHAKRSRVLEKCKTATSKTLSSDEKLKSEEQ